MPKGDRNFPLAFLVFQDNPLPMHLSINTDHIIPLSMQLSTNTAHVFFQKVRGDMRDLTKTKLKGILFAHIKDVYTLIICNYWCVNGLLAQFNYDEILFNSRGFRVANKFLLKTKQHWCWLVSGAVCLILPASIIKISAKIYRVHYSHAAILSRINY